MRRKPGTLVPLEVSILSAAVALLFGGEPEFHGYAVARELKEREEARRLTAHGTLYRALERLEKAGFLRSQLEDPEVAAGEQRPRRRLYQVTAAGEKALAAVHAAAEPAPPGGSPPKRSGIMTAALIRPPGAIPVLTRSWVRFYCTGMSDQAKAVRQLEIESDLWEHFADKQAEGVSPAETNIEMFGRLLRGVPSDIAWRFQAEGFQMNINIPLERFAGILILFLIVPFMMGSTLGGYDFSREGWSGEFDRFADISPGMRDATGILHALSGLVLVAAAALFFTLLRERSPKLVTVGAALLMSGGVVMLMNAAVYRAMSTLAEDYVATGDQSILAPARGLGVAIETLSIANMAAMAFGIFALSMALTRLEMLPRWTAALPLIAVTGLVTTGVVSGFSDTLSWIGFMVGFFCIALWLIICGIWLLFGGSNLKRGTAPEGVPA